MCDCHAAAGLTCNKPARLSWSFLFLLQVTVSVIEIYCERIRDLLEPGNDNLQVQQERLRGITVAHTTEVPVSSEAELVKVMQKGLANRAVASTAMNTGDAILCTRPMPALKHGVALLCEGPAKAIECHRSHQRALQPVLAGDSRPPSSMILCPHSSFTVYTIHTCHATESLVFCGNCIAVLTIATQL